MEEINIKEVTDYFKSKIGIIIISTILLMGVGFFYQLFIQKAMYKSSTTLVLNKTNSSENGYSSTDIQINKNLVPTYREIIKSRTILDEVKTKLDLNYGVSELSSMIEVTSITNTELIKITVTSKNSKEAMKIANELGIVFKEAIVDIYNMENVSIIDRAEESNTPFNINILKYTIMFISIGFCLGFGLVFVLYFFDNTIKDEKHFSEKYDIPILGVIPMVKGEK